MRHFFMTCFILLAAVKGFSQDAGKPRDFYFLQGVWKGTGWQLNKDAKEYFKETETVTLKLSGTAVQVEAYGVGFHDSSKVINDALGILKYNIDKAKYELNIYQSDGSFAVADVHLKAVNELEWSLIISPSMAIKYIIRVTGNKWYEAGFRSTDGANTWKQHFEMNLVKDFN